MTKRRSLLAGCAVLALASCTLLPHPALAGDGNDPIAKVPKLLQALEHDGFEALQGKFRVLNPISMACAGVIPSTWYNNVQPYLTVNLPPDWENTPRVLPISYSLRQDEALLIVGNTPPPMAYFSFQTFLLGRYSPVAAGGFFDPYKAVFAYLGDTINALTVRTTGSTPYNRPMAFISTGNRKTQARIRAALRSAGYPDAAINTETLPPSLLRFGYDNADQFLFLWRTAIATGGDAAIREYQQKVIDPDLSPLRAFRVRPATEFPSDPLPAPVLRTRGTGQTEMDLYPAMEKLRQAILHSHENGFNAEELDTWLPEDVPEGYPAIQRGVAYLGPSYVGSAGYGRDANYWLSSWFDLPEDGFAIAYGVDHAATGKATYSSAAVYLDRTLTAGVASADSADFAAYPFTANQYLPGEPDAGKFYVWKIARNCNGEPGCMEARLPDDKAAVCAGKIAPDAPVRVGFRQYAEPATKVGPADEELIYDRVIVFRPQ